MDFEILYTKPKSKYAFVGHLIRRLSKNRKDNFKNVPSHMAFRFGSLILEARGGGVRITYLNHFLESNTVIASFKTKEELNHKETFITALEIFYGRKYDYKAVFWYAVFLLRRKIFGVSLPQMDVWQSEQSYYCSELLHLVASDSSYANLYPYAQMKALKNNVNYIQTY